jgi:bifunctional UDP-N-acetylglucosamine pyrophosphorylase/glucosamine-1-phosphate N-acetyltransferase
VGDHVRIGSDTMLVAPVTIGDGAFTAAGSVITEDVPAGALGIARGQQHNSDGWVERRHAGSAPAAAAARAREQDSTQAEDKGAQAQ